jgi:hypothetical protein
MDDYREFQREVELMEKKITEMEGENSSSFKKI